MTLGIFEIKIRLIGRIGLTKLIAMSLLSHDKVQGISRVAVAEWLTRLTAKQEVFSSNMHVGKGSGCYAGNIHWQRCCTRGDSWGRYIICMPPPSVNKAAYSGFETQSRYHRKSKTGVSVIPKMDMFPTKILKKRTRHGVSFMCVFIPKRTYWRHTCQWFVS